MKRSTRPPHPPATLSYEQQQELLVLWQTLVRKLREADELTHQGHLARQRARRAGRRYANRLDELQGQMTIDDVLEEAEEAVP